MKVQYKHNQSSTTTNWPLTDPRCLCMKFPTSFFVFVFATTVDRLEFSQIGWTRPSWSFQMFMGQRLLGDRPKINKKVAQETSQFRFRSNNFRSIFSTKWTILRCPLSTCCHFMSDLGWDLSFWAKDGILTEN